MNKLVLIGLLLSVSSVYAVDPKGDALVDAAAEGNLALVKKEIKDGANVNYYNPDVAFTALMAAAQGGYKDVVSYLISKGAKVNMQGFHGATALQLAVMQKQAPVVEVLLNVPNININLQDEDGHSAYDYHKAVNDLQINKAFANYIGKVLSQINFTPPASSTSR